MFSKLKIKSRASELPAADPPINEGQPPTKRQIYQSRHNFGVNIGSCFVNEKWIFDEIFIDDTEFELEAAKKSVKKLGKDGAREKFENHWQGFMSDDDWNWLKDHQVTAVRVPLGYWQIDGGKFADDTKFEKYTKVYANAWSIFKSHFVEKAAEHDIGVLVDIHGLPGGANGADHSGEKNGGSADFWEDFSAQVQMTEAFKFIAQDLADYENIIGIQIVNESEWSDDAKRQKQYYSASIKEIREVDRQIPIIISDGWNPHQWVHWVQEKQNSIGYLGVVVDHHVYRCFSDDDKNKAPEQIIGDLQGDILTNLNDNGRGVDFMVGEYSCVLDGQSWDKNGANDRRDQLVIDYGNHQLRHISERAGYGSFFWTYKFKSGNGGEWDFKTMTDKGAIRPPYNSQGDEPDQGKFEEVSRDAYHSHCNYWNSTDPNEHFEHERYWDGFTNAWADSMEFHKFNGSIIGRNEALKLARLEEHKKTKGELKHLWEFEQGYDAGLKEFRNAL